MRRSSTKHASSCAATDRPRRGRLAWLSGDIPEHSPRRVIARVLAEDNWIALGSWTPARLIRATLCGQQNRPDIASIFGGRADRSQMTADLARPTKPTSG